MNFVALLRGVNVGGHKKIPMAELREVATRCGFESVATYIQSGNLVFGAGGKAASVGATLEKAIAERFGHEVAVIVRTEKEWSRVCAGNPFEEEEPNRVVAHLSRARPAREAVALLRGRARSGERIEAVDWTIWVHYPEGQGRSDLSPAFFDRAVGSPVTARNWNTIQKLAALLRADRGPRS